MSIEILKLLERKEQEHGDFESNATIAQDLKSVVRCHPSFHSMTAMERETIDMVFSKVARHVSNGGHPNGAGVDNLIDIVGYTMLPILKLYLRDSPVDTTPVDSGTES